MCENRFYICEHCGNLIGMINDAGVPMMCCGQKMTELVPNTVDAAQEKHVPVVEQDGDKVVVKVGSVEHPMVEEHWIEWILIKTEKGIQRKILTPGDAPMAKFALIDDRVLETYAYCNLHGLWKAQSAKHLSNSALMASLSKC